MKEAREKQQQEKKEKYLLTLYKQVKPPQKVPGKWMTCSLQDMQSS